MRKALSSQLLALRETDERRGGGPKSQELTAKS
jgi:hypothetical protein